MFKGREGVPGILPLLLSVLMLLLLLLELHPKLEEKHP
jgi:hypothetical protein